MLASPFVINSSTQPHFAATLISLAKPEAKHFGTWMTLASVATGTLFVARTFFAGRLHKSFQTNASILGCP